MTAIDAIILQLKYLRLCALLDQYDGRLQSDKTDVDNYSIGAIQNNLSVMARLELLADNTTGHITGSVFQQFSAVGRMRST